MLIWLNITLYIFTIIYGLVIGSFLNVCILRIPKKESIVTERSHCVKCGNTIQWYDLVPLFSYLFLGGKCRYCKEKISIQYPIVEAANAILYCIVVASHGWNVESLLFCLCSSALLALSVIDWRTYEIPLSFNIFIGCLGLVRICFNLNCWLDYVIGFFAVSVFLCIVDCICRVAIGRQGVGGGDIKLMAATGLLIGWKAGILSLMLGCVLGAIIHTILMRVSKKEHVLAFGPYLSMGVFISMLYGEQMINWYLSSFY